VPSPACDLVGGGVSIRASARSVGLVDYHQIPRTRGNGPEDVRLLQEIQGRDPHAGSLPGAVAEGAGSGLGVEARAICDSALDVEPLAKLVRPLRDQGRRQHHQQPGAGIAPKDLSRDQAGLYSFSEADFIGDQKATVAGLHSQRRLELVGKDVGSGVNRSCQRSAPKRPAGEVRKSCAAALGASAYRPHTPASIDDTVERGEERPARVVARDVDSRDETVASHARHSPPPPSNPHEGAGLQQVGWHYLQPRRGARLQKLQHGPSLQA